MRVYVCLCLVAILSTYLYLPFVRVLAIKLGAVGEIRARDVHTVATPRMGGAGMLLGLLTASAVASSVPWLSPLFTSNYQMIVILAGAVCICFLGILDDIYDLNWMLKMSGQLFIAVFVAWKGVQVVAIPWGRTLITASPSISMAVTAFLIVASINAVNFVDGLDGLAAGIVAIGGISFAIYSYILARTQPNYASLVVLIDMLLVGVCVGFLMDNWHPARLFMGDSGSMLLGYLITCASVLLTGHLDPSSLRLGTFVPAFMPILLPLLVLFIPFLDMCLAVIRRVSKGQSPMKPDRMHLHHRMLRIGHSVRSAVLILWGWALFISATSLLTMAYPIRVVAIVAAIGTVILAVLTLLPHYVRRIREILSEEEKRHQTEREG